MNAETHLAPKVHPLSRLAEAEDPLEMVAVPLAGDPELMLRCVVEEYARMGWDAEQILKLFEDPFYPALAGLRRLHGDAGLTEYVTDLVRRPGAFRVRVTVWEAPGPEESEETEPEMVELGLPASWRAPAGAGGSDHV
jgi:hypothetical protein